MKRQVRVISAHGRITGWVLSALPTALALFFAFTNPAKYATFYTDPLGMQLIAGALVLQVIGVLIIKKIVKIEYRGQHVTGNCDCSSSPSSLRSLSRVGAIASLIFRWSTPGTARNPKLDSEALTACSPNSSSPRLRVHG